MSDPHRLRSQSLVISSDKTLAARAGLRVLIHPVPRPRACPSRCVRAAPNSRIFAYAHRGSASGVIVKDD